MLAQTGGDTDVSQKFAQTEPAFLEMGAQTEPSIDVGTSLLSPTQGLDNFMDGLEQTGVKSAKGKTNNQMSDDEINQIVTDNTQHETNMQQQEKTEENSADCQFKSVSLDGRDTSSKLVERRIDDRITEIDEKIKRYQMNVIKHLKHGDCK
jgi:hypothetical protein